MEEQDVSQSISAGMIDNIVECAKKYRLTSPDEIALYDRQIRLWGVQAQEKYIALPTVTV